MNTLYQIILLGDNNTFRNKILQSLYLHTNELGLDNKLLRIIDKDNFSKYKANSPSFCIYFGNIKSKYKDLDILKILQKDATLILPVFSNSTSFKKQIPKILRNINGFELSSSNDIEKLVSCILEGLSLLRLSRRIFISYKRDESSAVAIQLFEQLEKNGFDVFLDTHSIRPGESFQDELWHRLADTDVVVLLNTPGFLKSKWTTQELAKANSMSIGILQLVWPTHKMEREAELSIPIQLSAKSFGSNKYSTSKSYLTVKTIELIVNQVESLRARSLASRQDNIISEFIASAMKLKIKADLQSEKFIIIKNSKGNDNIVIPTVGVPQAFTYNQSEELISRIKSKNTKEAFILYDHRNIREKWLNHLAWLDNYLPIKTIKIVEAQQWLKKI